MKCLPSPPRQVGPGQYGGGSVEWDFSDGEGSTTPPSPPNCSDTTQVRLLVWLVVVLVVLVLVLVAAI